MNEFKKNEEIKVEIKIDEQTAAGKYSNFSSLAQSNEEFIADFLFINPSPPPGFGKLMSRIIMSPVHAKRLYLTLKDNIEQYEQRNGEIKITAENKKISTLQ